MGREQSDHRSQDVTVNMRSRGVEPVPHRPGSSTPTADFQRRADSAPALDSGAAELPDDPRLMQAVKEYQAELEAGRRPSRQELLRRYADLGPALAECLDGLDLVHQGIMPASGLPGASTLPRQDLPLNPLGDFQVVREIGRGGMGIVYEAVQLSLGRRVALKVLPFAATLDPRHLQRFQNEAQAAAHLHHTNIVPVYAVGCERGVHFYAMQLIEGQSLAAVIEQIRELSPNLPRSDVTFSAHLSANAAASAQGSSRQEKKETVSQISMALSTHLSSKPREFFRTAARYMVQAAEALEHAHQFGIVHRDIKPANLLVDGHGRIWVTDFGLAHFHADTGLTQTGDVFGTLRYMSPEQASGQRVQLDHRTDVYSLGATLYELATLKPIFPGQNRHELLQQITNDEPQPPRVLEKSIPVELETIILKAVSKHPADRYASARELAADLQRYLDDQPILAKRPSFVDRVRKWSRRHPSWVAAGVMLLVLCIAGLTISNWMIGQEQANTAAAWKNEKERAAEARRALGVLVDVAEEEMADQPFLQPVRKRLLMTALSYYQDFIDSHGQDASGQAELEAGKNRVRSILDELATLEGANLLHLATDSDVQTDLKLLETQRGNLTELRDRSWEQYMGHFRDQGSLSSETRRQKLYQLAKTQEAALSEILQPEQVRRLRQIELQLQGPRAFHEAYAVEELKLTAEQKRKIREFKDEALASLRAVAPNPYPSNKGPSSIDKGPPEKGSPGPPQDKGPGSKGGPDKGPRDKGPFEKGGFGSPERREQIQKIQKAELERILTILTPEQQSRWQEMTGDPFSGGSRRYLFGRLTPKGPPPGPKE